MICHWFEANRSDKIKGVALAVHGLNLRPDKMGSVIAELTAAGIAALNVSLCGHEAEHPAARLSALKKVTGRIWREEVYEAYKLAVKRSEQYNLPLFFVGFSLGGLLGPELFASAPDVRFDKMVLLAPAFCVRTIHHAIKLLAFFPRLVIPSFSPISYRTNKGTPVAAYNALFEVQNRFMACVNRKINISTLIIIDKDDEFVSPNGLIKLINKKRLDCWKMHVLRPWEKQGEASMHMHHLIIDEQTTGRKRWQEIATLMISHLQHRD